MSSRSGNEGAVGAGGHNSAALQAFFDELTRHHVEVERRLLEAGRNQDAPVEPAGPKRVPVRRVIIDALLELGGPTPSAVLGPYAAARFARPVAPARFGPLARDERRAFFNAGAASRPVWLCNGVTPQDFRPVKRILALSTWPLHWRVIAPTTPRRIDANLAAWLCAYAIQADTWAADPEALRSLALALARDVPGLRVDADRPDFRALADGALRELERFGPEDERLRREAAARLAEQPEFVQLFGTEPAPTSVDHPSP